MVAVVALMAGLVMASGCVRRVAAYNIAKTGTDLQIVSINEQMSTDSVLMTLDKKGLRPMTLEDFNKLSASSPKIKNSFYVTGSLAGFADNEGCNMILRYCGSDITEYVLKCGETKDVWPAGTNFGAMPK